jgi:hypothetical protein
MNERITLAERISALKLWQITGLGITTVAAGVFSVAILANLLYNVLGGDWWWAVAIFHIFASGAAFIYLPKPFILAWETRNWVEKVNLNRVKSLAPEDEN